MKYYCKDIDIVKELPKLIEASGNPSRGSLGTDSETCHFFFFLRQHSKVSSTNVNLLFSSLRLSCRLFVGLVRFSATVGGISSEEDEDHPPSNAFLGGMNNLRDVEETRLLQHILNNSMNSTSVRIANADYLGSAIITTEMVRQVLGADKGIDAILTLNTPGSHQSVNVTVRQNLLMPPVVRAVEICKCHGVEVNKRDNVAATTGAKSDWANCSVSSSRIKPSTSVIPAVSIGLLAFSKQPTQASQMQVHHPQHPQGAKKEQNIIRFKIESRVNLSGVSESYIFGFPMTMSATTNIDLDWENIEADNRRFTELLTWMDRYNEGLVVSSFWQLFPTTMLTPLNFVYLLVADVRQSQFVIRSLATRDQLLLVDFQSGDEEDDKITVEDVETLGQEALSSDSFLRESIPIDIYNPFLFSNNLGSFYRQTK